MNFEYKHLLSTDLAPTSRAWVYQCNRVFTLAEALDIEDLLNEFAAQWQTHGAPVKGGAYLLFGQFIVLLADETATNVSGCSTDSSEKKKKSIEQQYSVNLFDRTMLAFILKDKLDNDQVQLLPLSQLQYAVENNFITADTLFFNNMVQTKAELENKWIVPVKESWLAKKINEPQKN